MNKNLKKVISSVAALSMVASSVVASAAKFPDVESDAYYAQAVQELSSLGVISGYTDGTFGPDNLVTRAEITKMIVDALAEKSTSSTASFTDTADHWAVSYIEQGVTDGWIAGMGDGTFAPDANVTYVQAQKMLVCAIGYDSYAVGKGGWPAGYKLYATQLDITSGVQDVTSDDQELTRAQVAQMIDNAMDAPLCIVKTYEWNAWGTEQYPVLETKDGTGKDYQTLFTDKHDAYKVYGRVTATSKSGTGLDADQVTFQVEKADNFDDEYIKATDDPTEIDAYIGDSGADQYLTVYAQALIRIDGDDEYTILSIAPAAANRSVTVLSEDVDESKTLSNFPGCLYFYPAEQTTGSVKYALADDITWYLNGVKQDTEFDEDALNAYIIDNETNTITLQKTTKNGSTSTDSNYDTVMITSYTTAVVDSVVDKTTYTQINFKEAAVSKSSMRLEKDDDTKSYSFTLNGEAIDPTDLQEDDILSISYDESDFADSDFYDVLVSRDVVESVKCTGALNSNNQVTLGGTKYKISHGMNVDVELSSTYTIYLDSFGRIAYADEDSSTKKIAILKNVYQKSNDDWVADLITKEGSELTEVKVDDENGEAYKALLDSSSKKSERYPEQVVEYKLSSSNKLTITDTATLEYVGGEDQEYKATSNKLGSIRLSDSTVILDMSDIDNKDTFKVISADDLVDGVVYTAYGYDKSTSDSSYRFVIITDGFGGVDSTTQLAVFLEAGTDVDDDDNDVDTMTVVIDGEQTTVAIDEDYDFDPTDLTEGDLILYAMNAGYVTEVHEVFAKSGVVGNDDYEGFRDGVFELADDGDIQAILSEDIPDLTDGEEDDVRVTFGVLVKYGNSTAFATEIKYDSEIGYYVNLSDATSLATNSNTNVYTYNYDNSTKYFGRIVLDDGIITTSMSSSARYDLKDGVFDQNRSGDYLSLSDDAVSDGIVFAVLRTFDDDEVQEVYQIVAE